MLRKLFLLAIVAAVIGAGVFWFVTIPATVPASALSSSWPDRSRGSRRSSWSVRETPP